MFDSSGAGSLLKEVRQPFCPHKTFKLRSLLDFNFFRDLDTTLDSKRQCLETSTPSRDLQKWRAQPSGRMVSSSYCSRTRAKYSIRHEQDGHQSPWETLYYFRCTHNYQRVWCSPSSSKNDCLGSQNVGKRMRWQHKSCAYPLRRTYDSSSLTHQHGSSPIWNCYWLR